MINMGVMYSFISSYSGLEGPRRVSKSKGGAGRSVCSQPIIGCAETFKSELRDVEMHKHNKVIERMVSQVSTLLTSYYLRMLYAVSIPLSCRQLS